VRPFGRKLPLKLKEGRPDSLSNLSERLKEWAVWSPRVLMKHYLDLGFCVHVHLGVVGDEPNQCAVFGGLDQLSSPSELRERVFP
jgi:hypothetical protein